MSGETSDEQVARELQGLVEQELQRLGKRAIPRVEGHWLIVGSGATEVRADIQGTLAQWDSLPEDLRERRSRQIAERLAQGPEPRPIAARPERRSKQSGWPTFVLPLLVVLITAVALLFSYRVLAPDGQSLLARMSDPFHARGSGKVPSVSSADPDRERAHLAASACDRARARVSRGGTISAADVEGWEIELVLLRRGEPRDLTADPRLSEFIEQKGPPNSGSVVWRNAKSLVDAQRFDAQVRVSALPALGDQQLSGLSLIFSGPYAVPYFTEELRPDYAKLAEALAEALSATDGALFARCASVESHYIGSWFLGATPGAAVASLVYFMGSYSDFPILKADVLGNASELQHHGHAFDVINRAAGKLDRGTAATLVGRELGMISGRPSKPTRLSFPFRDANRAARASLDAARSLGLASAG